MRFLGYDTFPKERPSRAGSGQPDGPGDFPKAGLPANSGSTRVRSRTGNEVAHLRFVHSTITTTCLALITAALLTRERDVERAYDDIGAIVNLTKEWTRNPRWLEDYAATYVLPHLGEYDLLSAALHPVVPATASADSSALGWLPVSVQVGSKTSHMQAYVFGRAWTLRSPRPFAAEPPDGSYWLATSIVEMTPPRTLADFVRTWNDFAEPHCAYVIEPPYTAQEINSPEHYYSKQLSDGRRFDYALNYSGHVSEKLAKGIHLRLLPTILSPAAEWKTMQVSIPPTFRLFARPAEIDTSISRCDPLASQLHVLKGDIEVSLTYSDGRHSFQHKTDMSLECPLTTRVISLNAQSELKRMAGSNWTLGPFDRSFPELNRLTELYQSVTLGNVREILFRFRGESRETFTIWGVGVRGVLVRAIGITVLIALQIYLILHLHVLANRITPSDLGLHYPWIGLHKSPWSRLAYVLSAMLLPTLVVTGLAANQVSISRTFHETPSGPTTEGAVIQVAALIGAVLVSGALAAIAFYAARRTWQATASL